MFSREKGVQLSSRKVHTTQETRSDCLIRGDVVAAQNPTMRRPPRAFNGARRSSSKKGSLEMFESLNSNSMGGRV